MNESNDTFAVELGRRAPFSQLGDWVVLSGASGPACKLYWILSMHVNIQRGNREVWPPRATLAELMGYARAKAIDPYVTELETLGALTVIRAPKVKGISQAASRYIVHQEPPADYAGLRSNAEFYRARAAVSPAEPRVPSTGHGGVSPNGDTGVPSTGHPVSPFGDTNKNEVNNITSPLRGEVNRAHDARPHASTTETPQMSTGSTEPAETLNDHAPNTTPGQLGKGGRGAMLSAAWAPSPQMLTVAAGKHPGIDLADETDGFVNHFVGNTKFRRTEEGWQGAWRNWMRRAWKDAGCPQAPSEPDLFEAVDQAAAESITEPWLAYWARQGTVVTPALRAKLGTLVAEALGAGATPERIKEALKLCKEPYPAPFRWDKAMAGIDPYAGQGGGSGGGLTFRQRDQRDEDLKSARGWQRVAERKAAGTDDDPMESFRAIVEGSIRKAAEVLDEEERGSVGGDTPRLSPMQILRGEIA